ncbi:NADH dehydrogenase [ubiquinone] 1 beta subcomplex subunit 6 isoform X2 [Piliocolobus tephrosceles]|uniref:NADH dehydrogenase [ubiquinone] 1 beta subcomplex subunit 6 isoform X2 n=1 Tax=Piliocolobus tephrosceles TaxID=591936 RepID=UPI000E6B48AE|nr:NADH dehydrogenase [ubiquinone] 1 beta subcomplex subunit 6 isoform X2 [Piliocolobus tephrosceles]
MTGYTPDEKLRLQQLRELRRRWLKDQELSPREPVLPPQKMWPMEKFWNKFLENKSPWRKTVHGVYQKSIFIFTHVLVPAWIIHYYMKYHVSHLHLEQIPSQETTLFAHPKGATSHLSSFIM